MDFSFADLNYNSVVIDNIVMLPGVETLPGVEAAPGLLPSIRLKTAMRLLDVFADREKPRPHGVNTGNELIVKAARVSHSRATFQCLEVLQRCRLQRSYK